MPKNKSKSRSIIISFPQEIRIHFFWTPNVLDCINIELRKRWPHLPGRADDSPLDGLHVCAYGPYPNEHWLIFHRDADKFTVLHEVIHCVDRMMDHFGFTDTEFRAYMNEYLYKQLVK
jgi:hypothetical protein